jgi:HAE1 family hydrophobic/amphiphilic exporter-1
MTRFFVNHPVTTWMLFLAFVVLAVYAIPRIEIEALPEVDLPSLTVTTRWQGASPKAVQRALTRPIEEAVRNVYGIESVTSTSEAGESKVEVEFRRDVDLDFARLHVGEQLGSIRRDLPLDASPPEIHPYVPEEFQTEQFFTFSIESTLEPNELREVAEDWILPQVLAVDGVADAQVRGGARPLLEVVLDRRLLDLYDIGADEVFFALDRLDELSVAGAVRDGGVERLVALREPVDVRRMKETVVAYRGGRAFPLRALGEVRPSYEDPSYFVRADGRNVVQVLVEKRSGANSVGVSRNLREALPRIAERTPTDVVLSVDEDEGQDLEDKLRELIGRSAAILVLLFLLLVLTLRQVKLTAIVVASIAFSLVICLSLFYFLGLTVNFITISGLTICFGMLLDNSILVLDAIHRRLRGLARAADDGLGRDARSRIALETIVAGTREVMFPILATTLTTMVAFLSFIFLSGRLALYYVPLAIAVATAMFASVFVAFGWIPVVLHQIWVPGLLKSQKGGERRIEDAHEIDGYVDELPDLDERPRGLQRLFAWNLLLWPLLIPALVYLGFWGHQRYQEDVIKGGFWRMPDQKKLIFYMRMTDGTDVRVTSETMLRFEELLLPIYDGADMRVTVFGNQAYMEVEFDDYLLTTGIPLLYRSLLVERADATGGTAIFISGFDESPYLKGNLMGSALNSLVKITGYNSKRLTEIAERTLAKVEGNRRVRNPRITGSERFGRTTNEETVISLRRDVLADHGLSVLEVMSFVRRLLGVDTPWPMLVEGEQQRVQLQYSDADDLDVAALTREVIKDENGAPVSLADLVTIETVPLSDAIVRENQRYTMLVNWEFVGTNNMRLSYIRSILDSMDLPYGYAAEEAQQQFLTEEEESDLSLTVILAAAFILMVLMALFESFTLPLLVLASLPMALLGVVVIFWKTGTEFDSSAQIGLVLLFGIVVNNAILLLSRFRTEASLILKARLGGEPEHDAALFPGSRRQLGGGDLYFLPRKERSRLLRRAIAHGTLVRLRSILLTSGTTIVGLLPLLVQIDKVPSRLPLIGIEIPFTLQWLDTSNQDIWQNLALTSIGGLVSSTLLILLAMPALYYAAVEIGFLLRKFYDWASSVVLWGGPESEAAAG